VTILDNNIFKALFVNIFISNVYYIVYSYRNMVHMAETNREMQSNEAH